MGKIVSGYNTYAGSTDNAKDVNFNNAVSGLEAQNVQDALDYIIQNTNNEIGTADISPIGDGTIKGAINSEYNKRISCILLADGTDLNSIPENGVYTIHNAVNAPSGCNNDWVIVRQEKLANNYAYRHQVLSDFYGRYYKRVQIDSTWNAWEQITTMAGGTMTGRLQMNTSTSTTPSASAFSNGAITFNANGSTTNRAGFGLHNSGINGAYVYLHNDGYLHMINSGGVDSVISCGITNSQVPTGGNLNNYTTQGFYRLQTSLVNAPSGTDWSQMIVSRGSTGDTIVQIIIAYNTGTMYVRGANGVGTSTVNWSAWKKVITTDNFSLSGSTLAITL